MLAALKICFLPFSIMHVNYQINIVIADPQGATNKWKIYTVRYIVLQMIELRV